MRLKAKVAGFVGPQDFRIRLAVKALHLGGVIAYPTEAVWGLGCDPFNGDAVARILSLKQRPVNKGLILVAATMSQLQPLLDSLTSAQIDLLASSWPGPHTWLIPHRGLVPQYISGHFDTVAVRVSAHPVVQALCQKFGGPIVSTSANPQGKKPARNRLTVQRYFCGQTLFTLPGRVGEATSPSQIRDLQTGAVVRSN